MPLQHSARKTTKLLERERRIHLTFLLIFSLWEVQNSFIRKSPWTLNSSFSLLQNHANFSMLRAKFGLVCLCRHSTTSGLGWSFCQPLSVKTALIPGNTCSQTLTSGPSKPSRRNRIEAQDISFYCMELILVQKGILMVFFFFFR